MDQPIAPLMLFVSLTRVRCALPVAYVREVMRPLPVTPLGRTPAWCLGVSIIRGAMVPVVDLGSLLWGEEDRAARRLVTLELNAKNTRRVLALRVRDVIGLRTLATPAALPSLLGAADAVHGAGLDDTLTLALEPARLISEEVWASLDAQEAS